MAHVNDIKCNLALVNEQYQSLAIDISVRMNNWNLLTHAVSSTFTLGGIDMHVKNLIATNRFDSFL
jgi:hypothetical protein